MKLSTRSRYGLRALLEIALEYEKQPTPLSKISDKQGISLSYLEQLMIPLKKSNIVKSVRGARGGYILAKPPAEISVLEIMRSLEGPIEPVHCLVHENEDCNRSYECIARRVWLHLSNSINEALGNLTLGDLIKDSITIKSK